MAEAKRIAPSVLFIDEFQAIFTSRSSHSDHGGNDIGQSLSSALAAAFDSIHSWNQHAGADSLVLVVGATNEPWAVDEGFLRQGRFDRAVFVGPLKIEERQQYIQSKVATLQKSSQRLSGVRVIIKDVEEDQDDSESEENASVQLAKYVASVTERYLELDLQLLVQRAWQAAIQRTSRTWDQKPLRGPQEIQKQ